LDSGFSRALPVFDFTWDQPPVAGCSPVAFFAREQKNARTGSSIGFLRMVSVFQTIGSAASVRCFRQGLSGGMQTPKQRATAEAIAAESMITAEREQAVA
jgi:hypothetical protein